MIAITIINSMSVKPHSRVRDLLLAANPKRELRFVFLFMPHQSEYLVPSSAVACDFE